MSFESAKRFAAAFAFVCCASCEASFSCGTPAVEAPPPPAAPAPAPVTTVATAVPAAAELTPKLVSVDVPPMRGHVNDDAHLLTAAEASALEAKLSAHEKATRQQFALLTRQKLPGVSAEDFGFTVANRWKLGSEARADGLLVSVALDDRALDIRVGRGLERAIPNDLAARVIAEQLRPAFREKRYAAGLGAAFDRLIVAATLP
jgi:uncharacterized protein